ncbi:hypothetical protein LCGC14_0522680 [marine sediment metagenome]|uniref:Uncharacterized protein n=1 Tax=marine sediment metagenome TaxID=412755 RepID=A0A0F9UJF1_9ZZZZ
MPRLYTIPPKISTGAVLKNEAWKIIGDLVKNENVEDAARILDTIQHVWEAVEGAREGRISVTAAHSELKFLCST